MRRLEEEGFSVTYLRPDPVNGLSIEQVREALRPETILVSIMQVNNETGAVFPVADIARMVKSRAKTAVVHADGVQGFGKLVSPAGALDAYSTSAHKIHGPKGAGALYLRSGVRCRPLLVGGGHEASLRAGTENVPGIAGFAAAAAAAGGGREENYRLIAAMRSQLVRAVESTGRAVMLSPPDAIATTLAVAFPPIPGEVMVNALSEAGVAVSTGSACAASRNKRSHVLEALGFEQRVIDSSVRFSLSRLNTAAEVEAVGEILAATLKRLRPVAERVLR